MSKVKVNKELFNALESTKDWVVTEERRLELMMNYYSTKSFVGERKIINGLNSKLFLEILRFGYELDLTSNEKDLREYNELEFTAYHSRNIEQKELIEHTVKTIFEKLNKIEVYIEGVNK